jgi:limonene 1,2-monooxygenase
MRFGLFMAPFHPVGQNPTLALERDLELIVHLDRLGFDEVWIGEHHSAGYEIIASPEVFIATAAERTKHIRLGSGVNSLPYHHPLLLADRFVLLDHLTRGRAMLGCGPGQLTSDAHMLGIPADEQRPRMHQALEAIMHLLRSDEPLTMETDGFTIRDARLQLKSYTRPHLEVAVAASISPTGAVAAGTHGIGLLSIAATSKQGFDALGTHWAAWTETAERHGNVADRAKWRLVGPMHLAETKEEARRQVEYGIVPFSKYFTHVLPAGPVRGETAQEIIANVDEDGFAVIGTPDDAIAKIQSLADESGGFGTFLLFGHDWARPADTLHSFELFAQYVMPHFQNQLDAPAASCEWVTGSGGEFVTRAANAIMKAIGDHAAERQQATP